MNSRTLLQRHPTAPQLVQRHPALRWLAPAAVVVVAAVVTTGVLEPSAPTRKLPHTSPASLVADLQASPDAQFTGTLVSTFSLGLPGLPDVGNVGNGSSFTSLLGGSHTMQVWYGGSDRQRVALFGSADETDVFRNGRSMWQWSSANRTAVHMVLPAGDTLSSPLGASQTPAMPSSITNGAIGDLDSTTSVKVGKGPVVADRSTYQLTFTPHDDNTRVARVVIAVDGATKVPLAAKVYAHGDGDPVVSVQFTSIRFTSPSKRNFTFTPPPGARVHSVHIHETTAQLPVGNGGPSSSARQTTPSPRDHTVRELGQGWSRVVSTQLPTSTARAIRASSLYAALRPVSGSWGKGRVLDSDLMSVLITSRGRVLVGAVDPSVLYSYAAQ